MPHTCNLFCSLPWLPCLMHALFCSLPILFVHALALMVHTCIACLDCLSICICALYFNQKGYMICSYFTTYESVYIPLWLHICGLTWVISLSTCLPCALACHMYLLKHYVQSNLSIILMIWAHVNCSTGVAFNTSIKQLSIELHNSSKGKNKYVSF